MKYWEASEKCLSPPECTRDVMWNLLYIALFVENGFPLVFFPVRVCRTIIIIFLYSFSFILLCFCVCVWYALWDKEFYIFFLFWILNAFENDGTVFWNWCSFVVRREEDFNKWQLHSRLQIDCFVLGHVWNGNL